MSSARSSLSHRQDGPLTDETTTTPRPLALGEVLGDDEKKEKIDDEKEKNLQAGRPRSGRLHSCQKKISLKFGKQMVKGSMIPIKKAGKRCYTARILQFGVPSLLRPPAGGAVLHTPHKSS